MIIAAKKIVVGNGTKTDSNAVLVQKGKIAKVGRLDELKAQYPDEEVTFHENGTLMPGLIDMHNHFGYWWGMPDKEVYDDYLIAYLAYDSIKHYFAHGVTTARDAVAPHNLTISMVRAAEKGYIDIPRLIPGGDALCQTGGYANGMVGAAVEVDGPWEIKKSIRASVKRGAKWIKVLNSKPNDLEDFSQEELNTVVEEAHRLGVKAMVHADTHKSIEMCINAGFDTIEHGTFMTLDQAERMVKNGQYWNPTVLVYTSTYENIEAARKETGKDEILGNDNLFASSARAYRENLKTLAATGVKMLTGTDMFWAGAPKAPLIMELKYQVRCGIEPAQTIVHATYNGACALGLENEIGTVEEGKWADLLIVDGDPEENIDNMDNILQVYFKGELKHQA